MNETDTHMKIWKKNILTRESSDYKYWHELERAKMGSGVRNEFQWERNGPCNREEFEFYVIWNGNSEEFDYQSDEIWLMSLKDRIGCWA